MVSRKNKWILYLFILYFVTVLLRFVLALITAYYPTVGIDEFLYYSIGRSIATEGKLLFRGQSADYSFILYPLVLSPVYLFPEGTHFYRLLQLWNILLMSASVFPIFFLGKELLQSDKKAFIAAALSMLLPDFILGQLIFSEAILYPLFFTLMYCAYRYISKGDMRFILWVGFLGGLLYSTKPGAIVPAAVFLAILLFSSIIQKEKKRLLYVFASICLLLATSGFFIFLAKYAFKYEGTFFSVYESQLDGAIMHDPGTLFKTLAMYPAYFILACGIVGFLYPALLHARWSDEKRKFWWFVIASICIMIIGSVLVVERTNLTSNINLRYVDSYIPLMILFCFIPTKGVDSAKTKNAKQHNSYIIGLSVLLGYVVLCILLLGCKMGKSIKNVFPLLTLSILNDKFIPLTMQYLGNIIIVLFCIGAFAIFVHCFKKEKMQPTFLVIMTIGMLINGLCGYSVLQDNSHFNFSKDGLKVQELTENKPYIYLLSTEGITDIGIDVNTKNNNCVIFTNDFINCLQRNGGYYVPFVPDKKRGMAVVRETPDVDTLVVSYESMRNFQLSQYAASESPYDRNTVFVIHFTPGKRIVDSTLGNLINQKLPAGRPGILLLYNTDFLNKPITISMEIDSEASQEMTINSTHELYTVALTPGRAWYDVSFNSAEVAFNFLVQNAPIKVYAYKLSFPTP